MIMTTVAFILGLILCLLFGVPYIDFLQKKSIGQYVLDLAPEAHKQKQGTPTTGGVFIVTAIILSSIVVLALAQKLDTIGFILLITLFFYTLAGFQDDYLKLKGKSIKKQTNSIKTEKKEDKKYSQYELASRGLLYYMLKDEKIIEEVEHKIAFFPDNIIRNLANEMIYYYHKYGILNVADFISYLTTKEEEYKLFKEIVAMSKNDKYNMEEIEDYIKVINSYPIKRKVNELNKKLKEENDPIKQANILSEILSLKGVKE